MVKIDFFFWLLTVCLHLDFWLRHRKRTADEEDDRRSDRRKEGGVRNINLNR